MPFNTKFTPSQFQDRDEYNENVLNERYTTVKALRESYSHIYQELSNMRNNLQDYKSEQDNQPELATAEADRIRYNNEIENRYLALKSIQLNTSYPNEYGHTIRPFSENKAAEQLRLHCNYMVSGSHHFKQYHLAKASCLELNQDTTGESIKDYDTTVDTDLMKTGTTPFTDVTFAAAATSRKSAASAVTNIVGSTGTFVTSAVHGLVVGDQVFISDVVHGLAIDSGATLDKDSYPISTATALVVDTVDASTVFQAGEKVYDAAGRTNLIGTVQSVTPTGVTLAANNAVALNNNNQLFNGGREALTSVNANVATATNSKNVDFAAAINTEIRVGDVLYTDAGKGSLLGTVASFGTAGGTANARVVLVANCVTVVAYNTSAATVFNAGPNNATATGVLINKNSYDANASITIEVTNGTKFTADDVLYKEAAKTNTIGTVASVSSNTVTLKANNAVALNDADKIFNAGPEANDAVATYKNNSYYVLTVPTTSSFTLATSVGGAVVKPTNADDVHYTSTFEFRKYNEDQTVTFTVNSHSFATNDTTTLAGFTSTNGFDLLNGQTGTVTVSSTTVFTMSLKTFNIKDNSVDSGYAAATDGGTCDNALAIYFPFKKFYLNKLDATNSAAVYGNGTQTFKYSDNYVTDQTVIEGHVYLLAGTADDELDGRQTASVLGRNIQNLENMIEIVANNCNATEQALNRIVQIAELTGVEINHN